MCLGVEIKTIKLILILTFKYLNWINEGSSLTIEWKQKPTVFFLKHNKLEVNGDFQELNEL